MSFTSPNKLDLIASPQLVVFEAQVAANIERMIGLAAGPDQASPSPRLSLRPHLKTHKMQAVTAMQMERGISSFKASTLGEVEMAAGTGATSVLLAHQPVGPKITALFKLREQFANCSISALVDDIGVCKQLDRCAAEQQQVIDVFVDIDCGMHRTGLPLGEPLHRFLKQLRMLPALRLAGWHVYDGHLHQSQLEQRVAGVQAIGRSLRPALAEHSPPVVIAGGTPTFPIWVAASRDIDPRTHWQFSPGTSTLWDWGYGEAYPDLPFEIAAAILTRIISKPQGSADASRQWVCLDVGYKAVAAEMPLRERLRIVDLPEAEIISHSEEHLVISVSSERQLQIGQSFWALPRHICPSVARYTQAYWIPAQGKAHFAPIHGRI